MDKAYDQLTNDEKMLVNAELQNSGKTVLVAFLLWFLFGSAGAHNFYLGRNAIGITQLFLTILGWVLFFWGGFVLIFVVGVWIIVDLFSLNKYIEIDKNALREKKAVSVIAQRS